MKYNNIVLIGFMGCGKTFIGEKISKSLNIDFVDVDSVIQNKYKISINDIFLKYGEAEFRKYEYNESINLKDIKGAIISTGGGCVLYENTINNFIKNNFTIYLKANKEKILFNLQNDNTRPLLKNNKIEKINTLMKIREPLYKKYSNITININNLSIENIIELIKYEIKKNCNNKWS